MALCAQLSSINATSKAPGGDTGKPIDRSNGTPGLDRMIIPGTVIEKWRTVQHCDVSTPIIYDDKTFWKCNHHKDSAGRWTFMYARHKKEDHEATVSKFKKKRPRTDQANATASQSGDAQINKLAVGDKLKEVICSRLLLGDKDVDDICNEVFNDGKDAGVIGGGQGKD